ncbi:hypothetical protein PENPOL_c003G07576 [Penicillium polonicum]|uniref:FAD dependent oxidoreductase domain-containing protein n=1 Tax=Penicillium polonicum TaxID=60169 RepID=A0A1V6NRV5_PENPO|nr:hypothetical protein PENPOL_c003G07576 [Penicillium polonicum]
MDAIKGSRLPAPSPVQSFWNADPKKLDDYQSTPELPSTADIVIIGSGLSGVATAYFILKDNPNPPSIVLLEARQICSGATGRNGGHVKPDTYSDIPKFTKLLGVEAASQLAAFEASHVQAIKELVETENLECDFHMTRALDVYLDAVHANEVQSTYKSLYKLGTVDLRDVTVTSGKDAERISGIKNAKCCVSYTAAHLWPSKLVHQLLAKLVNQGLNLQAHTPVSSVSPSQDKKYPYSISTPRGNIQVTKVVHATNAYASSILPEYTNAITPVRGVCCHIESPQGTNTPHLVNTYGIRFDKVNNDYLIPRADGSIIVGGARQAFWHQKDRWFDNVQDNEIIGEAVPYFSGYMQRYFRGWEDSQMKATSVWTGSYSSDFMPHIGEVPGRSGQFVIAGFTGYGMPKILLSSKGLAAMVRDGCSFEQTGLPGAFQTSKERNESKANPMKESFSSLWMDSAKL